jgi:flagellar basal body-associated protein FliL
LREITLPRGLRGRDDDTHAHTEVVKMLTIILIVLLVLLLFGGFGYRSRGRRRL